MLPLRAFLIPFLLLALAAPAAAAKTTLSAELAMDEKWAKPQEAVSFPLTLTAASPVRVVFEVARVDGRLLTPVPNPITLREAGAQALIPLTIQTPYENGYLSETGRVTYRLVPNDGSAPIETTVTVHTKGLYVPAPAPVAFVVVLAVVAMALTRSSGRSG